MSTPRPVRKPTTLTPSEENRLRRLDADVIALREMIVRALAMVQLARKAHANLRAAEREASRAYFVSRRITTRIRRRLGVQS